MKHFLVSALLLSTQIVAGDTISAWRQKINGTVDSSSEAVAATGFFAGRPSEAARLTNPAVYTLKRYAEPLIGLDDFEHTIKEYIGRNPIIYQSGEFLQELVSQKEQGPATYYFFGDFHGDIRALVLSLERLAQLGIIGDDFGIKDPRSTLIFLGDYVDRGLYGAEVHYLLMTLKLKNPERVVLIRGNHEDENINQVPPSQGGGYWAELSMKFFPKSEGKQDLVSATQRFYSLKQMLIQSFYPSLPVALYVGRLSGSGEAQRGSYALCCHGGPDLGLWPQLDGKNQTFELPSGASVRKKRAGMIGTISEYAKKHTIDLQIHDVSELINDSNLGYQWSDFNFTSKETAPSPRGAGATIGEPFLRTMLTVGNDSKRNQLHLIIRGHQHSTGSPLIEKGNHGMYVTFGGLVTTLCSTKLFTNNQASFLKLIVDDSDPQTWIPTLYYLEEMGGQWRTKPSLGEKPLSFFDWGVGFAATPGVSSRNSVGPRKEK